MTRLDAIRTIGDVITEIDVARGEVSEPAVRLRLDDARAVLNHRVIQLVHVPLDEGSERPEKPKSRGQAVLEAVPLNDEGKLLGCVASTLALTRDLPLLW